MHIIFAYVFFLTATSADPCMDGQRCASCDANAWCVSKCYDGYYGNKCKLECSPGCRNNICHLTNNDIGKCSRGCKLGFYGYHCDKSCETHTNTCRKCPQECEEGFCQLESTCAQGCQDSYYGTACRSCPAGCEVCNKVSGNCEDCLHCEGNCTHGCLEGCTTGYFGDFCEHSCNSWCMSGCNQTTGNCFKCKLGRFGSTCKKQCIRCLDEHCDMHGVCVNGCTQGWYGPNCESKCGCEVGICNRNGTCVNECKVGFYGEQCRNQCPATCFNKICDVENGSCFSCEKGFYGSHCDKSCERCVDGSCRDACQNDFKKPGASKSTESPQYWIAGVSLVFIIFLVILLYITYRFKRIDNELYNKVTWQAQTETQDVEQEDRRSCNTLSSLHTGSEHESHCSQVGVQVVVLKQAEAGSENQASLEDNVVFDKRVDDRELLTNIIVKEELASYSFNVPNIDVAEQAVERVIRAIPSFHGEHDPECDKIVDNTMMPGKDEKQFASCSCIISSDEKSEMMILEIDDDNVVDERRLLFGPEGEVKPYCDDSCDGRKGQANSVEDNLIKDRKNLEVEHHSLISNNPSDETKMSDEDCFVDGAKNQEEITDCCDNKFTDRKNKVTNYVKDMQYGSVDKAEAHRTVIIESSNDVGFGDHNDERQVLNITEKTNMAFNRNGIAKKAAKENQSESDNINTEEPLAETTVITESGHKGSQSDMGRVVGQDKNKHYVEIFLIKNNSETITVKM